MKVVIDGIEYLPANIAQPTMEELKQYLLELKGKSDFYAKEKVPAEWVKDDDRGRPFDKAYDKRYCFGSGFRLAISDLEYWVANHQKND